MKNAIPVRGFVKKSGNSWILRIPPDYIKMGLIDPAVEVVAKLKNLRGTEKNKSQPETTAKTMGL